MIEKVKDHPDWIRSEEGMLVNTNLKQYQAYLQKKKVADTQQSQINALKTDINNLNSKMDQILSLLQDKV
jgi:alpha-galactosidase